MNYVIRNNYELQTTEKTAIGLLLEDCFAQYPKQRIHLNQCPSFRLLVFEDQNLIAHLAVDFRNMNNSGELISVFGISDICVLPAYRSKKIATKMIEKISKLAQVQAVDFLILIAWDMDIYLSMGFQQVHNTCRWLMIHQDQSLGLAQRQIPDGLMIKSLSNQTWGTGLVDFMGPIF